MPGSSWYLNRVALAEIPAEGSPIVWSAPTPAKVVRTTRLSTRTDTATVSPGGRAFFVADRVGRNARRLEVADFDGHLVDVAGTAAAFVDDERLLVLRPGADPEADDLLVEVRPFHGPEPVWTKPVGDVDIHNAAIHVDRDTGTVFIVAGSEADQAPATLRTTLAPETPVDASPLGHRQRTTRSRLAFPPGLGRNVGGAKDGADDRAGVADAGRRSAPRLTDASAHLHRSPGWQRADSGASRRASRFCCSSMRAKGASRASLGRFAAAGGGKMLGPSSMAILYGGELHVLDLKARRGTRLKLPENKNGELTYLVDGALATLARPWQGNDATLIVYEDTKE